jgi:uncharacterized protein
LDQQEAIVARFDGLSQDFVDVAQPASSPDVMYRMGLMYCAGRDVPLDLVTAHKWLNLAAVRGNQEAKARRMEIALDMTKAQIAAAQKQAREWMRLN